MSTLFESCFVQVAFPKPQVYPFKFENLICRSDFAFSSELKFPTNFCTSGSLGFHSAGLLAADVSGHRAYISRR